jgi:ABC-type branched-subunit amino acid transport system ATPase component/ABC-type branched-subunit amino acid transport system permease subunit
VSSAVQLYVSTLLIYLGVDIIAALALNLQFGVAGIVNFSFILFQAVGAYVAAVLTLGPSTPPPAGFQDYVLGATLPYPLPLLAAAGAGGLLSLAIGVVGLRRLRTDYQAMVLLVFSLIATIVVTNETGLFNGSNGLSLVPKPLADVLGLSPYDIGYQWFFVGIVAVVCVMAYGVVHAITSSPLGRNLRAMRDNEHAATALGKDVTRLRMLAFVVGGALAAVSGALLVEFISAWSPGSWFLPETFSFFAAVIVGGAGNNFGAIVGALLVPVAFLEATSFIPTFGRAGLVESLKWVAVGLLIMIFLAFWPRGMFPERRRRFRASRTGAASYATAPSPCFVRGTDQPIDSTLLEARSLRREYGGVHAVEEASFTVPAGRITGLIGPNGAGKTTVLGMLAGAVAVSAGNVLYQGAVITRLAPHQRAQRGLIRTFQQSSEFTNLSVLENLLVAVPRARGDGLAGALLTKRYWRGQQEAEVDRARALLERFAMTPQQDELAGSLSGGQRRLVEIMRALMARPQLLLLDEPMAGVNPTLARRIEEHLADLRADGLTMLMVEHELGVVDRLCDAVIVMARGRVIAHGPMSTLRVNQDVLDAYLIG